MKQPRRYRNPPPALSTGPLPPLEVIDLFPRREGRPPVVRVLTPDPDATRQELELAAAAAEAVLGREELIRLLQAMISARSAPPGDSA